MKIKVQGNTTAQIRAGIEPWETAEVDVPVSAFSPEARELLASNWRAVLDGPATPEAVVAAYEAEARRKREQQERFRRETDAKVEKALAGVFSEKCRYFQDGVEVTWEEKRLPTPSLCEWELQMASEELAARYRQLRQELDDANRKAREAAFAAKASEIEAARRVAEEARQKEEAERKARREEEARQARARRAEIQAVEIPISRGDPQVWGVPWGAVVKGRLYDFSQASYDPATEILTIHCQPGDVIAWGQKNYRKPRRTIKHRAVVLENWDLRDVE